MKTLILASILVLTLAGCAGPAGTAPTFPTPQQIRDDGKAVVAVAGDVATVKQELKGAK